MRIYRALFSPLVVIVLAGGVTACGAVPYVLDADEFNRSAPEFGKDVTDISDVTICYSRSNTTPDAVRGLAEKQCATFGKTSRFVDQDYLSCPMATPVAANFLCDAPKASTGSGYYQY